jgi:predicted PurR-regulated permease PerM
MRDRIFLALAIIAGLILLFLWQVKGMLTAFIIGLVLAYLLNPIVKKLERYGLGRTGGSLILVVGFYLVCLVAIAAAVPALMREGALWLDKAPDFGKTLATALPQIEQWLGISLSLATLAGWVGTLGQDLLYGTLVSLGKLAAGAAALGNILALLLITPLVAFYMMRAWPHITTFTQGLIPPAYRKESLALLGRIDRKLAGFVRGQLMVSLIQGLFYGFGLWLVGIPLGFVLGLLTGVLSFIPVVGGLVGMALTLLVTLTEYQLTDWVPYALVLLVFATGNMLESLVLSPKLLGNSVGLHPVWVIFALLAGGHIAGILGMLVAVPIAAIVSELLPLAVHLWRQSSLFKGK